MANKNAQSWLDDIDHQILMEEQEVTRLTHELSNKRIGPNQGGNGSNSQSRRSSNGSDAHLQKFITQSNRTGAGNESRKPVSSGKGNSQFVVEDLQAAGGNPLDQIIENFQDRIQHYIDSDDPKQSQNPMDSIYQKPGARKINRDLSASRRTNSTFDTSLLPEEFLRDSNITAASIESSIFQSNGTDKKLRSRTPTANRSRDMTPRRNLSYSKSPEITPRGSQQGKYMGNEPSFTPRINKRSTRLASRMAKSQDRLTANRSKSPNKWQVEEERELTFKPSINKLSHALDHRQKYTGTGEAVTRWDSLYEKGLRYNDNKERLREEKLVNEAYEFQKNCTFKPQINRAVIPKEGSTPQSERFAHWQSRRDERLMVEREENLSKCFEECTFQPNTKTPRKKVRDEGIPMRTKGIDKFLERQMQARTEREEINRIKNLNNGEKWRHQVTIPKTFKFNTDKENVKQIKALKKPITYGSSVSPGGSSKKRNPNRLSPNSNIEDQVHNPEMDRTRWAVYQDPNDIRLTEEMDYEQAVSILHNELHALDISVDM
mmetsp:Transcript_17199/g.19366  ORF Transcript_17199/g.19366 Transcript_17199/m.19366 type:complete len:546 (-) Transcript_17199:114-1751(-)